ncbi:DUF262 domain-containing protein [Stenotrophomonas muris]|uniref:DUF262 domain-containing protein n=1 Tax=Stenotrophomonas muris TaxID=2963283 RepID=UPI003839F8C0
MATTEQLAADPVTLLQLFSADNVLRCPLFQRPYVWKNENINKLWTDIDSVLDGECDVRFLGALVFDNESASTSSSPGSYWVIDGQQRLTTLYLSLCALALVAREAGDDDASDSLTEEYLLSRKSTSRMRPKLSPTLRDTRQFNQIVLGALAGKAKISQSREAGESSGAMSDAYELIKRQVRNRCLSADGKVGSGEVNRLREVLLEKLEFVEIRLGQRHDANEVFDRLNKEGARLGIVDLVRNEVLKRLRDDPQSAEEIYHSTWKPFEDGFESLDSMEGYFFPHALSRDSSITKSRTFNSLADRWLAAHGVSASPEEQVKAIMADVMEHVGVYRHLKDGVALPGAEGSYKEAMEALSRMRPPSVVFPYFFSLHLAVIAKEVPLENATRIVAMIESFLFRRAMFGLEPTGLHAVFKVLWNNAGADPGQVRASLETKTIKFPTDAEFEEAVRTAPMYSRKVRNYGMLELERRYTRGDLLSTFPPMTADHILPQSAKESWRDHFTQAEMDRWKDTWANLVPLSGKANAEKGTRSWTETQKMLRLETIFSTTKHVLDKYDVWNASSLQQRSNELVDWALKRWPDASP